MNYRHYIFCLLLLFCSGMIYGQKTKKSKSKSKIQQPVSQQLIKEALSIKDKSPTKAIKLAEEAISYARSQKDRNTEGKAYALLGNIYEDINQKELAIQRYLQALPLIGSKKNTGPKVELYQKLGQLYLDKGDLKSAKSNFTVCIEDSFDKKITLRCEEGLADIALRQKDGESVVKQLDSIEARYVLDSIKTALNEARRAQAYAKEKDFKKASEAYNNSLNTLPKSKEISKEDFNTIQKTQKEILVSVPDNIQDQVDLRSGIADNKKSNFSKEDQIIENLKISELYEEDNNLPEADKFIAISKTLITPDVEAAVAAEVYKKSSKTNQRKGRIDEALNDLELYISAKEKAINQQEENLKEQVEIVKGQQQIDISRLDYDLSQKDSEIMQSQLRTQQIIIGLLSLVLISSLVLFYFLYKNVKEKRKANQRLYLKSLRTQMNPHFIFNALNSVNNFIAKNDEKAANKFLSDFSRLMRKVLDHSQKDFISFEEEVELNELYLKLEHFRFRDKFDFEFENNAQQHGYSLDIPPMLIQPFIENAVWHGLRYKEEKGQLKVSINEQNNTIKIIIQDDGIGRKKSKELKTSNQKKYKSTGLENISKRVALINELYDKNYEIKVTDLDDRMDDTGTLVEISIPVEG